MRKACLVVSPYYGKNRIFDIHDRVSNRDDCLYLFHALQQTFREHDIDLATQDIHGVDAADLVLYNEMPAQLPGGADVHKSSLILFESELIRPDNWDLLKHRHFSRIFTWNDTFVDNSKYFKVNFSNLFPAVIKKDLSRKVKLCTLIAGRKRVNHPLELYSKRVEAIQWFERNHPDDFDLYGMGWDGYKLISTKWSRKLDKKIPFLTKYLPPRFPSYRGSVASKRPVLEQYRFSICYENARDIPGYITEKIFDCFFAGCVPVYWGANNVTDHIPQDCFIDKKGFAGYADLYRFMKDMDDRQYLRYQDAIETFITSKKAYQFTGEAFGKTIVDTLLSGHS